MCANSFINEMCEPSVGSFSTHTRPCLLPIDGFKTFKEETPKNGSEIVVMTLIDGRRFFTMGKFSGNDNTFDAIITDKFLLELNGDDLWKYREPTKGV